jgi:hypothetical protein
MEEPKYRIPTVLMSGSEDPSINEPSINHIDIIHVKISRGTHTPLANKAFLSFVKEIKRTWLSQSFGKNNVLV